MKTAGILGGMGPQATVDLMQRVIDATPARDDCDHVHMIVDNNPQVPSRIKALIEKTGESPGPVLARMAKGLARAGAHFLAMPCNTAHAFLPQIRAAVDIPVLDMIGLTVARLAGQDPPLRRAGLLASPAVAALKLYETPLASQGIELICPPDIQPELLHIIRAVKKGDMGDETRARLAAAASRLGDAGAESVIIACTEFSVITDALPGDLPAIDALQVLAEEIVSHATTG
ncbi:MAG TPA: amino acid racemase [Rhizobiales bacterium]|nr:amino acid racemase [Hyphomicrobiales bacterium]